MPSTRDAGTAPTPGQIAALEARLAASERLRTEAQALNTELATLCVAALRLHQTVEWDGLMMGIREVLVNLVGSEDFVLFRLRDGALHPLTGFGAAFEARLPPEPGDGLRAALRGELHLAPAGARPAAWVPVRVGAEVTGVMIIHALLPHKQSFGPPDQHLLEYLAGHLGTALRSADLHAAAG